MEAKRLSIAQCKRILEQGEIKYSDDQVRIIRDILYDLGELDYLIFRQMLKPDIKNGFDTNSEKPHNL